MEHIILKEHSEPSGSLVSLAKPIRLTYSGSSFTEVSTVFHHLKESVFRSASKFNVSLFSPGRQVS